MRNAIGTDGRLVILPAATHVEKIVWLAAVAEQHGGSGLGNRVGPSAASARSAACGGNSTRRGNHGVVCIFGRRLRIEHDGCGLAEQNDRALDLAARGGDGVRRLRIHRDDLRGDFAVGCLAPSERADFDAALNGAGDFGGIRATIEGVRHLCRFRVRVNAVVLEPLHSPLSGLLHLRAAGKTRSDLRGEIFQVLHQFGVGLFLGLNLLIGAFHCRAVLAVGGAFGVPLLRVHIGA